MGRKAKWPPTIHTHARSGKAYIKVRVGGTVHDITLGPAGSPEAQARYAEVLARVAAGLSPVPTERAAPAALSAPTVADVVTRWQAEELPRHDPAGRGPEMYRLALRPLVRLYGSLPAADFHAAAMEALQLSMATGAWMTPEEQAAQTRRKQAIGLNRRVLARRVGDIRRVWKWAERKGLVPRGSAEHLKTCPLPPPSDRRVRRGKPPRITLEADLRKVLPHAVPPVAALLEIGWLCGARPGELRILRTCDVDRETGPVVDGTRVWLYRPMKHKNSWRDQDRVIALGPAAQAVLAPWLREDQPEAYLFCKLAKKRCKDRPSEYTTEPYGRHALCKAIRRACKKAGAKLTNYSNRHAFRMRAGREVGDEAARAAMGHRTITTTAHYGTLDVEQAARAARKLG